MLRGGGLGAQGASSSRDYAFSLGRICGTEIRMSYFVVLFFGYQMVQLLNSRYPDLFWLLTFETGNQILLLATVLCHEFGHGNMARYLGGRIDHILLWVFGGICFSTRPTGQYDNTKILRDDLLIVAAGPSTHFLQAPAWGLVMCLLLALLKAGGGTLPWDSRLGPWDLFRQAMNPLGGSPGSWARTWRMMPWLWACRAVQLNVALFLFNVFFPMYPADGSKLLVTGLMFCCGVPPRTAALILICTATPCAVLLILYAVLNIVHSHNPLAGVMGFMGVMSLFECHNLYKLRKARRLHEHALFRTARSWQRRERDSFGVVHRLNQGDFDDEAPLTRGGACAELCRSLFRSSSDAAGDAGGTGFGYVGGGGGGGGWSCAGCLACLLPCVFTQRPAREPTLPGPGVGNVAGAAGEGGNLRSQRGQFLQNMDRQRAERNRTVREYMDERYGGGGPPARSGRAADFGGSPAAGSSSPVTGGVQPGVDTASDASLQTALAPDGTPVSVLENPGTIQMARNQADMLREAVASASGSGAADGGAAD